MEGQTLIKVDNYAGLYQNPSFAFAKNAINVLIGPNGTGKTHLLLAMEEQFEEDGILFVSYSNFYDGRDAGLQRFLCEGKLNALASATFKSEGQQIMRIFGEGFLSRLRKVLDAESESACPRDTLWILIDSMDSGLDIPNIKEVIRLFELILKVETSRSPFLKDIYIVLAANSYEFVRGRTVIDVLTGRSMQFGSYEEYSEHITSTANLVEDRDERISRKSSGRSNSRFAHRKS